MPNFRGVRAWWNWNGDVLAGLRWAAKLIVILGFGILFGVWAWNEALAQSVPLSGWTMESRYVLPFVPVNAVVYGEYTNRIYEEREMLRGGLAALGTSDGQPYTLKQFEEDAYGRRIYLVITQQRSGYSDDSGRLLVTYFTRLDDGTVIHFSRLLGDVPKGTTFGHYEVVGTEATHPVLNGEAINVPLAYVRDGLLSFLILSVLVGAAGTLVGYCLLGFGGLIYSGGRDLIERWKSHRRQWKMKEKR